MGAGKRQGCAGPNVERTATEATGGQNEQTQGLDPLAVLAGTLPGELVPTSLGGFPVFAGALALILGALAAGSEYGWGTMQTALTQRPTRLAVYGGKLAALAASTLAIVLAIFALNATTAAIIATLESRPLDYPSVATLAEGIGSGWLIMGMWCGLGALLGFAFRGVALPVGLGVVWVLGVENLVSAVADSLLTSLQPLRNLLPGVNAGSLVWSLAPGGGAVAGGRATLSLAIYVAAFALLGAYLVRRRDVT